MKKQKNSFLLLVPFLLIFLTGCSNQRNNLEISDNQNNGDTVVESSEPVEEGDHIYRRRK